MALGGAISPDVVTVTLKILHTPWCHMYGVRYAVFPREKSSITSCMETIQNDQIAKSISFNMAISGLIWEYLRCLCAVLCEKI